MNGGKPPWQRARVMFIIAAAMFIVAALMAVIPWRAQALPADCLISFGDGLGGIIGSFELRRGAVVPEPEAEITEALVPPRGYVFDYWYIAGDKTLGAAYETPFYGRGKTAASDLELLPMFTNQCVVTFNTSSVPIAPVYVTLGGTVNRPLAPVREGYNFVYWMDENKEPFDFGEAITGAITLTAKWDAQTVQYTAALWVEKETLGADYTPTPGNLADYSYVGAISLTGTAGQPCGIDALNMPQAISNMFGGVSTGGIPNNPLKYAIFQDCDRTPIEGDGESVINIYARRRVYTYKFYTPSTNAATTEYAFEVDGALYNSKAPYIMRAKYESFIAADYPMPGANTRLLKRVRASVQDAWGDFEDSTDFAYWDAISSGISNQVGWASKRLYLDSGMIAANGQQEVYDNIEASYSTSTIVYDYRYFAEVLPGEAAEAVFLGVGYKLMPEYNQSLKMNLSAKGLVGFFAVLSDPETFSFDATAGVYNPDPNGTLYSFFYNRVRSDIKFYANVPEETGLHASDIPDTVRDVMFGERIDHYEPSIAPRLSGYVMAGWYTGANTVEPADFSGAMPPHEYALFAKWVQTPYTVKFYDYYGAALPVGIQSVYRKQLIDFADPLLYQPGDLVGGKGEFLGWRAYNGLSYGWFDTGTQISSDISLFAAWRTNGFTISYYPGEADSREGQQGLFYMGRSIGLAVKTRLLGDAAFTPPTGKSFAGWSDGARIYNAGEIIYMPGDLVLTALYIGTPQSPSVGASQPAGAASSALAPSAYFTQSSPSTPVPVSAPEPVSTPEPTPSASIGVLPVASKEVSSNALLESSAPVASADDTANFDVPPFAPSIRVVPPSVPSGAVLTINGGREYWAADEGGGLYLIMDTDGTPLGYLRLSEGETFDGFDFELDLIALSGIKINPKMGDISADWTRSIFVAAAFAALALIFMRNFFPDIHTRNPHPPCKY